MDPCKTDLESLLDQTIVKCNLRNILAEHGIPGDETVRFELSTEQGILASRLVPVENSLSAGKATLDPLVKLRDKIKKFLNEGQKEFNLAEKIEEYKTESSLLKVTLRIDTEIDKEVVGNVKPTKTKVEVSFFMGYMKPCYDGTECCVI